jgi:opacity protein-like surface antigen
MKKGLYFALIATQTYAFADSLTGFYIGGNVGTEGRSTQFNDKGAAAHNEYNKYNVGKAFGLHTGYGKLLHESFYLGGEIYLYATTKHKSTKTLNQNLATENRVEYKRGVVFGITPKIGHVFSENAMAYGKLGIEFSKDTTNFINGVNDEKLANISKIVPAFAPGFGLEHHFSNKIIGGIEYSYSIGKKISKLFNNDPARTLEVQRKSHHVMFRLSYKI